MSEQPLSEQSTVRVIALNGSPHRNGNTATLMNWVLEGCAEAGAEVQWLHIVDYDIEYCQGCFTCLREGACPIQDDFVEVRERLLAADGIVAGSPVYEGQPTAQLKTFLDRLTLLNLYVGTFTEQYSVGVATSGIAPTRCTAKAAAEGLGRCCGTLGAKTASLAHGYQPLSRSHSPRLPDRARGLGERLVRTIRHPRKLSTVHLNHLWIGFLRQVLKHVVVKRSPEQFAGVLRLWREREEQTRA